MTLWMVSGRSYRTRISSERQITREKNDEFPMTKAEGMTNDQMTRQGGAGSSSLGLWASFVIRHSCFVISGCPL
jgi:hypothetical protein